MNLSNFKTKFDWKSYITRYPDLKDATSLEKAWNHANNFGWKENRVIFDDVQLQNKFIAFKKNSLVIPEANINNEKKVQLVEEGIDMYKLNNLTDEHMMKVSKNVHGFSDQIKPYKNILFISGDYPGYGGAATNCYELQKYFKTLEHNTFGFYFNYETGTNAKHEKYEDHIIDDVCNLKSLEFSPDLIILKSPINMDLKSLFKCPVYYLIGGIYKNDLTKYYYDLDSKEENDKYINTDVLKHIAKYDKSFVNSQHTADILEKFYGVSTNIFYSSFVPYVDKKVLIDHDFEKRKYNYGLIVSNFERKIKNVEKSIDFLKSKENVILIGKGSLKYKDHGFTCLDLTDNKEMEKYYKQIKYIVQDSFYESCSNVKIEGLFNGCKINNIDKNIVIISENSPGVGGFGTRGYNLHMQLKRCNFNVNLCYIDHVKQTVENINENNESSISSHYIKDYYPALNSVYNNTNNKGLYDRIINDVKKYYNKYINQNTTIIIITPLTYTLICLLFPTNRMIYYCGSCNIDYNQLHYNKSLLEHDKSVFITTDNLSKCFQKTNVQLYANSYISKHYLDSQCNNKPIELLFTPSVERHHIENNNKTNDIIFISSCLSRKDKNFEFCYKILEKLPECSKIIIGKGATNYNLPNCSTFECLSQYECITKLNKSRMCLITSIKDNSPNIFCEAIQNKCIPIISTHVGNVILNYKYICSLLDINTWLDTIQCILENYIFDFKYFSRILADINILNSKFIIQCNKMSRTVRYDNPNYDIVICNNSNDLFNHEYIKSSFGPNSNIITSYDELNNINCNDNFIIFIDDTILPYNWIKIGERNKNLSQITNLCYHNVINIFNIYNSEKKLYVFEKQFVHLFETYFSNIDKFLYYLNTSFIIYHNETIGVEIKDNCTSSYVMGVLFINQFENNVFKQYIENLYDSLKNKNEVIIFVLYGKGIPLGKFEKSYNIQYVNEDNMNFYIEKYNLKKVYIPYLPLAFIKNKNNVDTLMNNHKIEKYIFIGGIISHMIEFTQLYDNFTTITVGESYSRYFKTKSIIQYPIWEYSPMNNLLKYDIRKNYHLKKSFINIGRISIEKNHMFLVKAFHKFLNEIDDSAYKLYIVGNDTQIQNELKKYIQDNKIHHNIIFLPWMDIDELHEFCYKNIDYHVSTSTNEGLSGVVLETMTMGIPSITGNICCINDIIQNNINGMFFEYTNYDKYLFDHYWTCSKLFVDTINSHFDENITNLVNVLKKTHFNNELHWNLSNNCYNYIRHNYFQKNHINYNECFNLKYTYKRKLFAFIFDSKQNDCAVKSINVLTTDFKVFNCGVNNDILKTEITKIIDRFNFIVIIDNNFQFISERGNIPNAYFNDSIAQYLIDDDDHMGHYFMTQNLAYGTSYNMCIYNARNFVKSVNMFNGDLKKFELLQQKHYNFTYNNMYIAFYNENNLTDIFNCPNDLHNNINFQYIKELFHKYEINKISDIVSLYKTQLAIDLNDTDKHFLNILINNCNIIEPIQNTYIESKKYTLNLTTDMLLFRYLIYINDPKIHCSFNPDIFTENVNIIDVNDKSIKTNIQYEYGFVYSHYISNNNFERKLNYYIKHLKSEDKKCCLIIPNNNCKINRIIFNQYFEDIVFMPSFNYNTLDVMVTKHGIKNLVFIDTNFNKMDKVEHTKLSTNISITIILSGLINAFNSYLLDPDYCKIVSTIITNSPAHLNLFNKYDIKMSNFWDTRKHKMKLQLKSQFNRKISYIGRFYSEKQCDILYNVFIKISKKYPDYTFDFYGTGVSLDNLNNTNNVKIYNTWLNTEEVDKVIENSDFIIQNSISEGNPAIVWESFKLGTPVICSNIYGNNFAVNDKYNGFLYDLDGYDSIKNDLTLGYSDILKHLLKYKEQTELNIYNCIESVINLDIHKYHDLQKNCLKSWESFSNDCSFDVIKLFG